MSTWASTADVIALGAVYGDDFSVLDADALALVVDTVTAAMLDADEWGDKLREGHRSLAAHFLAMVGAGSGGGTGAVTSRRVDKIQESYAAPGAVDDAELASTVYGRLHMQIRDTLDVAESFGGETDGWEYAEDGRVL